MQKTFFALVTAFCLIGACCAPCHAQGAQCGVVVVDRLKAMGETYNTHNPTTWSLDLTRNNIGNMRVILSCDNDSGILVTFVIVAKKTNIRKTMEFMDAVAHANQTYDYVKCGLDKDDDLFVRIDFPMRLLDSQEMKAIVDQVADAADALFPSVKQFVAR